MKRLVGAVVVLIAAGSVVGAQVAGSAPAKVAKVAICHKTSSTTRPYVRIVVASVGAHARHADDIIPAPARCPQTLLTARSGGVAINVAMRGVLEKPDPGDPDGTGTATVRLRAGQARVCFMLNVQDIGAATGAHIHRGTIDVAGPVVVPFTTPNAQGTSSGCVTAARALVRQILTNRTEFYVNVHTGDFPGGAIRAQLALPATAKLFVVNMTGAAERPNPADPSGTGTAGVLIHTDSARICYTIVVRNITLPTVGAHIHRGSADVAGPVVVPFQAPLASGTSSGCTTADATLAREITDNPAGFYVNVHTPQFPGGAVRGQLS
jgi:hypothetical protein